MLGILEQKMSSGTARQYTFDVVLTDNLPRSWIV